jgi:uncharacterized protein YbaA (DUF1428 family)
MQTMSYVDGFVLAVPKDRIEADKAMTARVSQIWRDHGAKGYVECVGDDVPYGELTSFPRAVMAKDDEVVIFSWITYENREARDACNAKVIADPRFDHEQDEQSFDGKRMIFGGFTPFLER